MHLPWKQLELYPAVNINKSPRTPRSSFLTFLLIKDRTTSEFRVIGEIPRHFHSYNNLNQKVHCRIHRGFGTTPLVWLVNWCHWCHWCHKDKWGSSGRGYPIGNGHSSGRDMPEAPEEEKGGFGIPPDWEGPQVQETSQGLSLAHSRARNISVFDLSHLQTEQVLFMLYKYTPICALAFMERKFCKILILLVGSLEGSVYTLLISTKPKSWLGGEVTYMCHFNSLAFYNRFSGYQ